MREVLVLPTGWPSKKASDDFYSKENKIKNMRIASREIGVSGVSFFYKVTNPVA